MPFKESVQVIPEVDHLTYIYNETGASITYKFYKINSIIKNQNNKLYTSIHTYFKIKYYIYIYIYITSIVNCVSWFKGKSL